MMNIKATELFLDVGLASKRRHRYVLTDSPGLILKSGSVLC